MDKMRGRVSPRTTSKLFLSVVKVVSFSSTFPCTTRTAVYLLISTHNPQLTTFVVYPSPASRMLFNTRIGSHLTVLTSRDRLAKAINVILICISRTLLCLTQRRGVAEGLPQKLYTFYLFYTAKKHLRASASLREILPAPLNPQPLCQFVSICGLRH